MRLEDSESDLVDEGVSDGSSDDDEETLSDHGYSEVVYKGQSAYLINVSSKESDRVFEGVDLVIDRSLDSSNHAVLKSRTKKLQEWLTENPIESYIDQDDSETEHDLSFYRYVILDKDNLVHYIEFDSRVRRLLRSTKEQVNYLLDSHLSTAYFYRTASCRQDKICLVVNYQKGL